MMLERINNIDKAKIIIGGVLFAIIAAALTYGVKSHLHSKDLEELKQENIAIQQRYDQKIGEARAKEQAAREDKALSDAKVAALEVRLKNVKDLDEKIKGAEKKYEEAKANLGDCGSVDDCMRLLCEELRAAFKMRSRLSAV